MSQAITEPTVRYQNFGYSYRPNMGWSVEEQGAVWDNEKGDTVARVVVFAVPPVFANGTDEAPTEAPRYVISVFHGDRVAHEVGASYDTLYEASNAAFSVTQILNVGAHMQWCVEQPRQGELAKALMAAEERIADLTGGY
jgi:hypothetical protein